MAAITPEFSAAVDHFIKYQLPMDLVDKVHQFVHLSFPGQQIAGRLQVSADGAAMMFKCVFSQDTPPARRTAMAELLVRVNDQLTCGAFHMDWSDGEVTFRETQWLTGPPPDSVMMHMVGGSVKTVERFRPAVLAVLAGASPEAAATSALQT